MNFSTKFRKVIFERVGFLKYFSFLKNSKLKFLLAIVTGILYGISSGFCIPVILKFSSEKVFSRNDISFGMLLVVSIAPIVAMTLRATFSIVNSYYLGFCGQKILQGLRVMIFDKIQRLPIEYFKKTEPGTLITRSLNDTSILQETIISVSQEIIKQPIALLGAIGALVFLCCKHSNAIILLIFFLAATLVVFPIRAIGRKIQEKAMKSQQTTEGITTKLAHNLSAVQEIRAFAMEESEVSRYRSMCDSVMSSVMKSLKYSIIVSPIIEIIASFGVGFAMFYAYKTQIQPSVFIALTGALYLSYEPIKKIAELNSRLRAGSASLSRIEDLLNISEKIYDPADPIQVDRLTGNITFDNVSFSYGESGKALDDVTIRMGHGKTYALVGSSGAGKTTMANLILRFYDVTTGAIQIDGIDIRHMKLRDLRKNISYVPQSPTLINGTMCDNIKWSDPSASFERVIEAAKKAYAHGFISNLENGYDTMVGEGGARLSGGQKQRIAIARAFLRDTPILILDEATSALDANSEHEVHVGIENLTKNRTTILISHRFTMMSIVDVVFVLEQGKIVEVGSPEELLQQTNSIYYGLYQKQRGTKQ
ncbi:MAG: ABC transporter ATP-binding protein/permease [Puniceicoccales bacterium]|jgi:subfamily B ATP-binding cassette protein MsbA|nr:ABC transporter ATP-binding protein/permease [Puniceicoccales bacterium]